MPRAIVLALAAFAVLVSFAAPGVARAGVELVVTSTRDAVDAVPGDGLCQTDVEHECTLRAAIMETNALPGLDAIAVPAGVYPLTVRDDPVVYLDENQSLTGDLDVTDDLILEGAGAGASVLDGGCEDDCLDGVDRLLDVRPGAVVEVSDVTLRRGGIPSALLGQGGAVRVSGADLTLRRSEILDSRAFLNGGGLAAVEGARVLIQDSEIEGSRCFFSGGGVFADAASSMRVERSVIAFNTGGSSGGGGGGIGAVGGECVVVSSSLLGNSAGDFGGGALGCAVYRSALAGNGAFREGGGAWSSVVVESTLSGNWSLGCGGGAAASSLVRSTVTLNEAGLSPFFCGGSLDGGGGVFGGTLQASIVAGNGLGDPEPGLDPEGPDCLGVVGSNGYNILGDGTECDFAALPSDRIGTAMNPFDPLLGPLADNGGPTLTHALLLGSLAVDTVPDADCGLDDPALVAAGVAPGFDQRGSPRPQGFFCDVGAFELVPACVDELDNDGDGLVDLADEDCLGPKDFDEEPGTDARNCGLGMELALLALWVLLPRRRKARRLS